MGRVVCTCRPPAAVSAPGSLKACRSAPLSASNRTAVSRPLDAAVCNACLRASDPLTSPTPRSPPGPLPARAARPRPRSWPGSPRRQAAASPISGVLQSSTTTRAAALLWQAPARPDIEFTRPPEPAPTKHDRQLPHPSRPPPLTTSTDSPTQQATTTPSTDPLRKPPSAARGPTPTLRFAYPIPPAAPGPVAAAHRPHKRHRPAQPCTRALTAPHDGLPAPPSPTAKRCTISSK